MAYKRIMVAIDGSETSDLALLEAIHLTKALHAKLCIINVADEFPSRDYFPEGVDLLRYQDYIRNRHQTLLDEMKKIAEKEELSPDIILAEITIPTKSISEVIGDTVKTWKADLLVLGTHGRRGFRRFLLGSVAEETVRTLSIPILLIRSQEWD